MNKKERIEHAKNILTLHLLLKSTRKMIDEVNILRKKTDIMIEKYKKDDERLKKLEES